MAEATIVAKIKWQQDSCSPYKINIGGNFKSNQIKTHQNSETETTK